MSYVTSVTASAPLTSTGGTTPNIALTSPLDVADGGTGATTPTGAPFAALSPSSPQTGSLRVTGALSGGPGGVNPEWFNVRDYGAAGNPSQDDGPAINAALSACSAAGGGVVYFPPGTYHTGQKIQLVHDVSVLSFGSTAILPAGTYLGNCYVVPPGNYQGTTFRLPSVAGFTQGSGIKFTSGSSLCDVSIEYVTGCASGLHFDSNGINQQCLDHTVQFQLINSCADGILLQGVSGNNDYIQGILIRGNFMLGNTRAIRFLGAASTPYNGFSLNDIYVLAVSGESGIIFDTGHFSGGNVFRIPGFGGFSQTGAWVTAINGASIAQGIFELGIYGSQDYSDFNAFQGGPGPFNSNVLRNMLQPIATGTYVATTASNSRASFNGGTPLTSTSFVVQLQLPPLSPGQTADFYVYSPFTTGMGCQPKFFPSQLGFQPCIVTSCEDETVVSGSDGNGPVANQIHIRVIALGTITSGNSVYGRIEVAS